MYRILLVLNLLILSIYNSNAQKIHLILVCATGEEDIRSAELMNKRRMTRVVKRMAENLNIPYGIDEYIDKNVTEKKINDVLNSFTCDSNTTVMFFYGGHGTNDNQSKYPTFLFNGVKTNLNLEKIHHLLKSKGAKNVISIADCCNYNSNPESPPSTLVPELANLSNKGELSIGDNYKQLFKEEPFDIITSSSISGQFSIYDTYIGGYYTMALETAMFNTCHREQNPENVSWKNIFSKAKEITSTKATKINEKQTPQFEINLNTEIFTNADTIIHIIQADETLFKIAQDYKVLLKDLQEWNKIENPNIIRRGAKLTIIQKRKEDN